MSKVIAARLYTDATELPVLNNAGRQIGVAAAARITPWRVEAWRLAYRPLKQRKHSVSRGA